MRAEAHKRLEHNTRLSLKWQLTIYGDALRHWGSEYLDDLASQFDASLAAREGAERMDAAETLSDDRADVLQNDLERLRQWSATGSRSRDH
jgi:hypothetical protein